MEGSPMLKHIALLLLTFALSTACTAMPTQSDAVRIDSSSQEAAEASYKTMMKGRSEWENQKLALAVLMLNMAGVKSAYEVVGNPELQSPSIGRIKDKVAGMTADEIITLAARTSDVRIETPGQ
jgi:hypothetical protein